ncbi:MAG TPA: tripartite tricarboxylate transporter substrate binding protein, partial [Burkholderiales bacterium]|nr:tripartite tricarboxylate transporter substrate binding protein [Burkholderiales bacterium]
NSTENRGQTTIFRIEGESIDMASWKIVVCPRFSAFIAAALVLFTSLAHAQDPAAGYPSRTIRIFGQGTGSTADYLSRYLALKLTERWGQAVIVDSRAGAGGTIPTDVVAKSPPDGYNLVMGHIGPMVSAVTLYAKNLPYDPAKDFEPITMVAQGVVVLVTHPSLPVGTAQEFIVYAKQKGDLAYGSAGNGSTSHLAGELLKKVSGIPLQHIPYKSAGNALTAVLAGEVPVSFLSPLTAHGQLKAGKVKALAVSSSTRFAGAPEIPSAVEAGIPGMEVKLWFGLFAPARTPRAIVMKLNREIGDILRAPETQDTFLKQGVAAAPGSPEELGDWVRSELARWTPIIQATGIKAD